jgi:hypothetical protein
MTFATFNLAVDENPPSLIEGISDSRGVEEKSWTYYTLQGARLQRRFGRANAEGLLRSPGQRGCVGCAYGVPLDPTESPFGYLAHVTLLLAYSEWRPMKDLEKFKMFSLYFSFLHGFGLNDASWDPLAIAMKPPLFSGAL